MSTVPAFYYTCPKYPDVQILCRPGAGDGRLLAQECLVCGQTHVLDPRTGKVVETLSRADAATLVVAA